MKLKTLFLASAICLSSNIMFADEPDPDIIFIDLKPIENPTSPKPKAPSRVHLTACTDGTNLTITSSVDISADILITDAFGSVIFDASVILSPDFVVSIPDADHPLTIIISTDYATFQGTIN